MHTLLAFTMGGYKILKFHCSNCTATQYDHTNTVISQNKMGMDVVMLLILLYGSSMNVRIRFAGYVCDVLLPK